jgi:MFS family permease
VPFARAALFKQDAHGPHRLCGGGFDPSRSSVRTMYGVIAPVAALLLSVAFLLTGNGLQGTLLAVRGDIESFSTVSLGLMGSTYFLGFAIGCVLGAHLIRRVGHIRTFTAMAAVASAVPLAHGLWLEPLPWWIMRTITGFCFAVLYIVIESWLNERSTNETRGTILSTYLVINLTVMTLGQMMMTLEDPAGFVLFAVTSMLVSISAVPVAITAAAAPAPIDTVKVRPLHLYRISPVAFAGCLFVGTANGTFWALGPVFAQRIGLDVTGIALLMSATILGGALGQWPFGRLSDRMDRRWVLAGVSAAAALCGLLLCLTGFYLSSYPRAALFGLAGLWGACAFSLYAIAVAHANDHAAPEEFVEVSSGLLLVFAAGSMVGPLVASAAMSATGAAAMYGFTALAHGLLGAYALWRIRQRVAPPPESHIQFTEALAAAQTVSETFDAEIQRAQIARAGDGPDAKT